MSLEIEKYIFRPKTFNKLLSFVLSSLFLKLRLNFLFLFFFCNNYINSLNFINTEKSLN